MIVRQKYLVIILLLVPILSSCTPSNSFTSLNQEMMSLTNAPDQENATALDPAATISALGPGGGGAFDVFAFSPEYVFVGTDIGGVFRSTDHGKTWYTANRGLYDYKVNDIAVDPIHPSVLYLASSGGVYKSATGGDSWQLLKNGFPVKESDQYSAEIGSVAVDPSNSMNVYSGIGEIRGENLARGNGDIYTSTNGGVTWNKINIGDSTAAIYEIVVDPLDGNYVYAATSAGFFRSTNSGQNWMKVDGLQSRGLVAGIDSINSKVIIYRTAWNSGVFRSENRGLSWNNVSPSCMPLSCHFYRIVLDPTDDYAHTIYVGDYGDWRFDRGMFVTVDGGKSWKGLNSINDSGWGTGDTITRVRSLGLNPYDPRELYYGHSMGIFRKYNNEDWNQVYTALNVPEDEKSAGGQKWLARNDVNNTQANTKPIFHPTDHDEYYIGFADIYIWKTKNDGMSWENIQIPGDNDVRSLAADPSDNSFQKWFAGTSSQSCCNGSLYKTINGGQEWERSSGIPSDRVWDIVITPDHAGNVYVATHSHGIYWSNDGGNSFVDRNGANENRLPGGSIYHIAIDEMNPNILYVPVSGTKGGIFKTVDAGENWQEVGDLDSCFAVAISSSNSQEIYAGCRLHLYKSENSGVSWSVLYKGWEHPLHPGIEWGGAHIRDIALHPVDSNTLCFVIKDDPYHDQASGGGLYCTIDGGRTWQEIAEKMGLLLRGVNVAFHPLPDPDTREYDLFYMTGGNGTYKIPGDSLFKIIQGNRLR